MQNQEEAFQAARQWLTQAIDYAHQRKIKIWLGAGDCPTVPPNLAKHSPLATGDFFNARFMPPGDSAGVEIWEAMVASMIETYPKADGYWIWLAEAGCPGANNPATQKVLRQYEVNGKRPCSDSDLVLVHYGKELIARLKRRHPAARVGLAVLFRSGLLPTLDALVPKDVPLASMEQQPWSWPHPKMENFAAIRQRETFLVPRLDDDTHEFAMQFNVGVYQADRSLSGSVENHLAGIAPQTGKLRGAEQNARYLIEGAWNPSMTTKEFYESYLRRIFGADALDEMLKAYLTLDENNHKAIRAAPDSPGVSSPGWCDFCNYAGPGPAVAAGSRLADPFQPAAAPSGQVANRALRASFAAPLPGIREALGYLYRAQPKALPGSRRELEYVIFKTEAQMMRWKRFARCSMATSPTTSCCRRNSRTTNRKCASNSAPAAHRSSAPAI